MPYDARVKWNADETRPVLFQIDAGAGNTALILSTSSSPTAAANPAYELRDMTTGALIASGSASYDTSAAQKPKVWPLLDIDSLNLAVGRYVVIATFWARVTGEGFSRFYRRKQELWVQ